MRIKLKESELRDIINKVIVESVSEINAYHGSPHDFERFDTSKMGSGEGCQAHGWGIYVTVDPEIGKSYAKTLSRDKKNLIYKNEFVPKTLSNGKCHPVYAAYNLMSYLGDIRKAKNDVVMRIERIDNLELKTYWEQVLYVLNTSNKSDFKFKATPIFYEVDIPEGPYLEEMYLVDGEIDLLKLKKLLYQKALPNFVGDERMLKSLISKLKGKMYQGELYFEVSSLLSNAHKASEFFSEMGYKGIHYHGNIDGECYVVFDSDDVRIINKQHL